jgi:hypothetical protein
MVVQMDFSRKTLSHLSILGERNAIFSAPKLFVDGNTTKCPSLLPTIRIGERGIYFTRFSVVAISIWAVADCGEV